MTNMTKVRKPRYTVANIVTSDPSLCVMSDEIRKLGYSHEEIYRAGLQAINEQKNNL